MIEPGTRQTTEEPDTLEELAVLAMNLDSLEDLINRIGFAISEVRSLIRH